MKLAHRLCQLAGCWCLRPPGIQLVVILAEQVERAKDVLVPQQPFEALEISRQRVERQRWRGRPQFFPQLVQHGQAHRDVEPVQEMLGLRAEIQLQVTYVLAAVGEKRDCLQFCSPWLCNVSNRRRRGFVS